jgi:hypothetical protein
MICCGFFSRISLLRPAFLGNHQYHSCTAGVRFFERRYLKAHVRQLFAVAGFSGFIPAHGLRSKALLGRSLKTGHVSAPCLDIALKNASAIQERETVFG